MGRDKLKRQFHFKPLCREFISKGECNKATIELLHEEIEAIYLSDILELYQEDAAKKMGISRPTFTRILKNARKKVATMLVSGASLKILDEKDDFKVAITSSFKDKLEVSSPSAPYLHIFHIKQNKILEYEIIKSVVVTQNKRPGQVLPEFLAKRHINFFITNEINQGLKDALLSKGIFTFIKKKITKDELLHLLY